MTHLTTQTARDVRVDTIAVLTSIGSDPVTTTCSGRRDTAHDSSVLNFFYEAWVATPFSHGNTRSGVII